MEIIKSSVYEAWLAGLRDRTARAKIEIRVRRLGLGNPGDVKPVGGGISEMRINYGPGYRVYYLQHGTITVVLLCGGDKSTQDRDVEHAKEIASSWKDEIDG